MPDEERGLRMSGPDGDSHRITINNHGRIQIISDGHVGIGTENPQAPMQIVADYINWQPFVKHCGNGRFKDRYARSLQVGDSVLCVVGEGAWKENHIYELTARETLTSYYEWQEYKPEEDNVMYIEDKDECVIYRRGEWVTFMVQGADGRMSSPKPPKMTADRKTEEWCERWERRK